MMPINIGTRPPPTTEARGIVRETAMFLDLGGTIKDKAAKPTGKKQTATNGCKNTIRGI
jgi:hypothetical protein